MQMVEQAGEHRLLAMGGATAPPSRLRHGSQLDQAELADRGKAPSRAARPRGGRRRPRWPPSRGHRRSCRRAHQPQAAVERRRLRLGQGANDLEEQVPHRHHAQPLTGDERLERCGDSSPLRSRRAALKTCRIGKSVNNPMASTTHKTTSCVNGRAAELTRPVAVTLVERPRGRIICSSPASRSRTRPALSAGSVQCPCGMRVIASLVPCWSANPR